MMTRRMLGVAIVCLLLAIGVQAASAADAPAAKSAPEDGNVWATEDGKHWFTCPVQRNPKPLSAAVAASVVDGKRYYHCCASSQAPFRSDPAKYLGNGFFLPMNLASFDASRGAAFRDPVTGQVGVLAADTPSYNRGVERWFFASAETRERFAADPAAYLEEGED